MLAKSGNSLLKIASRRLHVSCRCASLQDRLEPKKWSSVINDAETVVGYPTSFLNLRCLLNDEFANIAIHIKKLIGTNHPLLKTARNLLFQDDSTPCFGLIVLLVAKMGGLKSDFPEIERDASSGILHSQRVLAEVTEMIKTSFEIHKGLVNINNSDSNPDSALFDGNKIALLTGDYLLSNAFRDLANIRNQEVSGLMSSVQRDLVEGEFLGLRDAQNRPIPTKPIPTTSNTDENLDKSWNRFDEEPYSYQDALGKAREEWTIRTLLSGGSLLAKSCSSALKLGGHFPQLQNAAHMLGKHLVLTIQAKRDRETFEDDNLGEFSLVNAPLLFHLQHEPSLYEEIEQIERIDFGKLRKAVLAGPGIGKTKELQNEHADCALDVLKDFASNSARSALVKIVQELRR